jgi:hypothetical protein
MKKRAGPSSIPADFLNQLASYLHRIRDTGRCDTPIPLSELERLADSSGDPDARQRAWQHLAGCVFCLNGSAELRGAGISLQEPGASPAPPDRCQYWSLSRTSSSARVITAAPWSHRRIDASASPPPAHEPTSTTPPSRWPRPAAQADAHHLPA